MSVFKTSGVVLKVQKQNDNQLLYSVFFRDYGKLLVSKKKKTREKPLDIGYYITCEIITKSSKDIHTIGNIKILSEFNHTLKDFQTIQKYLEIIHTILKEIPTWVPHREIQDVLEHLSLEYNSIWYIELILAHIKIYEILWDEKQSNDITIQKILKFIRNNKISAILKLKWIDEEIQKKLEQLL